MGIRKAIASTMLLAGLLILPFAIFGFIDSDWDFDDHWDHNWEHNSDHDRSFWDRHSADYSGPLDDRGGGYSGPLDDGGGYSGPLDD